MNRERPDIATVKNELEELRKMAPLIVPHSVFGDDNRAAIDVQISVLEERMSLDDVYNNYDNEENTANGVFDHALEAAYWLRGESDSASLADDWRILVRKNPDEKE